MTEEYGIPEWGCYVIFAVLTIIAGLVLGLVSQQVYHLRVLFFSWICKAIFCQQSWRNKSYKSCPCYSSQVNLYDYKVCSTDISYWWCLSILIFAPISRKLNFKLYTYVHIDKTFRIIFCLVTWTIDHCHQTIIAYHDLYWFLVHIIRVTEINFVELHIYRLVPLEKPSTWGFFCSFLLSNCHTYIE